MMTPSRHRRSGAFTLLEILVAIALLAMVVGAIYASWNSILKGSRVALDAAAAAQRERITIRTLHDSLLCACMFNVPGTNTYYTFLADSDSEDSSLSFVARLPHSFPRSGKFGDLTVRRLEFRVVPGPGRNKQLILRQRPLIMDFDPDEIAHPLVLAQDINTFQVEFVDPQTGDWITDWVLTNQIPKEARITIGLGHLDQFSTKAQEAIVDVVALPGRSWQVPQVGTGPTGLNLGAGGAAGANRANGAQRLNNGGGIRPQ